MTVLELKISKDDHASCIHHIADEISRHLPVDHWEIYLSSDCELSIELEKGSLKRATTEFDSGFGIRVANDEGRIAFSYSSDFDPDSIRKTVKNVVSMMKRSTVDPDFKTFADQSTVSLLPEHLIFDKKIEGMSIADGVDLVMNTLESANSVDDDRIYSINVDFGAASTLVSIANSNGIELHEKSTDVDLSCLVTVKDGNEMDSDYDHAFGRFLNRISTDVGQSASKKALKRINKKSIKTGPYPVVFTHRAAASMIKAVIGAASAEGIQQGVSFLKDKKGKRIAADSLTVIDDGRLLEYRRSGTRIFDGEAVPTRQTVVINQGIFNSMLHNSYTAKKEGEDNTGNAVRAGYSRPPSIGFTNLIVKPEDAGLVVPESELINEISFGIMFDDTYDSPNYTTGDFSGMITSGFIVKDGEITNPIANAAFGINLITFLKSIEYYSKEIVDETGVITPAFKISSMHISCN
ncbi:MAG: TldD/PmbA family protein [Promethearchaeota archaeon]